MSQSRPKIIRLEQDVSNERPKKFSLKRSVQHEQVVQSQAEDIVSEEKSPDQLKVVLHQLINNCDALSKILFSKRYQPESQYTALFPGFAQQAKMEFQKLLIEIQSKE